MMVEIQREESRGSNEDGNFAQNLLGGGRLNHVFDHLKKVEKQRTVQPKLVLYQEYINLILFEGDRLLSLKYEE